MQDYKTLDKCLGYITKPDETNTDERYLVSGSQNVLINDQEKVESRGGYSRLGAANSVTTPIRAAYTWNNSSGGELPLRSYDDELEVYLGTVDGTEINAWTRVKNALSTTNTLRFAPWWDTGENIDQLIFVQGDHNLYKWGGGVAVVDSVTAVTITKKGTSTFAENRFYTTGSKTLVCVRTGTEYTYTAGENSTTLTGIADTTDLVAGDILVQKIVATADKPAAAFTNDTIFVFENQLCVGSDTQQEVYISKNSDYKDFAFSSPRVPGEGALLTLDDPCSGFGALSQSLIIFAGKSSVFTTEFEQLSVGATITETLKIKKLKTGINQSARSQEVIVPIGNALAYLSWEPALRLIEQPEDISGPQMKTLSNPIKPDFDAEDWTGAQAQWHKNRLYLSAPASSKVYALDYIEDANGQVRRFWQPPQILPVGPFSIISQLLYGHSNSVAETYLLFNGNSDINSSDEKLPIHAIAKFAYRSFGKRAALKNHDEVFIEGQISRQTNDLIMTSNYDDGGATAQRTDTIDGTDDSIIFESLSSTSLGQQPIGTQPIGGSLQEAQDAPKFRKILEMPAEDYHVVQFTFETNEIDRSWSILSHGPNTRLSRRQALAIKGD